MLKTAVECCISETTSLLTDSDLKHQALYRYPQGKKLFLDILSPNLVRADGSFLRIKRGIFSISHLIKYHNQFRLPIGSSPKSRKDATGADDSDTFSSTSANSRP